MYSDTLNKIKMQSDKYNNGVMSYLKGKYNQDFEILGSIGETFGASGDRWGVKPKNGTNNENFTVFGGFDETGYKYSDSFYSVVIQKNYEKLIHNILMKEFDSFKFLIDISKDSPNPNALNKNVAVEDIWRYIDGETHTFLTKITILLPYSESQENNLDSALNKISNKISEFKLSVWLEAYTLEQEDYNAIQPNINTYKDFEKYLLNKPNIFYIDNNYNVAHKNLLKKVNASPNEFISDEKLAQLCSVVYLNGLLNNKYMGVLGEILEYIRFTEYTDSMINGQYPCEMTKEQWDNVIDRIIGDNQLYSLRIIKSIDVNEQNMLNYYPNILPGHRAVCFIDNFSNAYVVFRGTCGDEEWYDNATGMVLESTVQQKASASFVNEIREDKNIDIKQLVVTGHSKGGNKAQFAAITTADGYVNRCVALDGQGFSLDFVKKYNFNIKTRANNIALLAEQRDFVNCLGFYIGKTSFYRGWRGNSEENMPYGYPMPYFHCPDALVNEYGILGDSFVEGSIPKTLNQLITFILDGSKYAKKPYEIAVNVIALLMKNKKSTDEQIAEAVKNVIMIFMEFIACSDDFKNGITELVYTESNVMVSTIVFATQKKTDNDTATQNTLSSLVISKLVKELFMSLTNLKYLVETLGFLIKLIKGILKNSEKARVQLVNFILEFTGKLFKGLSTTKTNKYILDFLFDWTKLQSGFTKQFPVGIDESPQSDLFKGGVNESLEDVLDKVEKVLYDWQDNFEE